uniref:GATA-type domain-containing protein n=1 Tax=Mycena chlorophos TaxID=658473 RepID=A0ABQ0LLY8_MYCCL|nr:predicted protein [Mycena chlorophos]
MQRGANKPELFSSSWLSLHFSVVISPARSLPILGFMLSSSALPRTPCSHHGQLASFRRSPASTLSRLQPRPLSHRLPASDRSLPAQRPGNQRATTVQIPMIFLRIARPLPSAHSCVDRARAMSFMTPFASDYRSTAKMQQPYPADPNVGQFSRDTVPHLDVLSAGFVPPQPQWSPHYVSHPVPHARYLPYPLISEGIPPLQGLAGAPPPPLQYIYSNYELSRTVASTSRFDPAALNLLPNNTTPSAQPPFVWNAFEPRDPSSNLNVSRPKPPRPKRRVPRHQHFTECPVCHRPAAECGQPRRGAVSGIMVCNRCGQYEKRKQTRRPATLGNSVRISRRPRQPETASAKGLGGEET